MRERRVEGVERERAGTSSRKGKKLVIVSSKQSAPERQSANLEAQE